MKKSYEEMFREAATETDDQNGGYYYKGYTGGNALSLYVNDKYNVNAAAEIAANDALCKELEA